MDATAVSAAIDTVGNAASTMPPWATVAIAVCTMLGVIAAPITSVILGLKNRTTVKATKTTTETTAKQVNGHMTELVAKVDQQAETIAALIEKVGTRDREIARLLAWYAAHAGVPRPPTPSDPK
jgi:hypothetical protein